MLEDKNLPKTPLSQIGELGLIQRIQEAVSLEQSNTIQGIGDDTAVLDFSNHQTLVSTETFAEGVHFNLGYVPLKHLGFKVIAAALSDICAMNGIVSQVMVSIAFSDRFPVEAIDELYRGILIATKAYQVDLVGGDTTTSKSGLIITITAIGHQSKEKITYRSGAKDKDLLVVSGDLGGAYFGLQILERENEVWKVNPNVQPDLTPYDYIIARQLKPEARIDIIKLLNQLDVQPSAMIDISDGLAHETLHLAHQSQVGFNIFEEKIPFDQQVISAGEEFDINPTIAALNGGEDYELLFTIPLAQHDKIKGNPNFTIIGHAVPAAEGNHIIGRGNHTKIPLSSQGWDTYNQYQADLAKEKSANQTE